MKTLSIFFFAFLLTLSTSVFAQTKKESLTVAGECGMCQKKIEDAAKKAGASMAAWDSETKLLSVAYDASKTDASKIEKAVAAVGYDTKNYKAEDAAYNGLHGCCKYERKSSTASAEGTATCCASEKCTKSACMKDGKCVKDSACCKDSGCTEKACCQKGTH